MTNTRGTRPGRELGNIMSTWAFIEAPFGGVAYTVHSDGEVGVTPARGLVTRYPGTVHEYVAPSAGLDEDGERAAWTFNGKRYTTGVAVEIRRGSPSVRFGFGYDDYTESARRQLSEWLEAAHPTLATPAAVAAAVVDQAEHEARAAAKALTAAQSADKAARAALTAARKALAKLTK